jgi:hypothetical protein
MREYCVCEGGTHPVVVWASRQQGTATLESPRLVAPTSKWASYASIGATDTHGNPVGRERPTPRAGFD